MKDVFEPCIVVDWATHGQVRALATSALAWAADHWELDHPPVGIDAKTMQDVDEAFAKAEYDFVKGGEGVPVGGLRQAFVRLAKKLPQEFDGLLRGGTDLPVQEVAASFGEMCKLDWERAEDRAAVWAVMMWAEGHGLGRELTCETFGDILMYPLLPPLE
jgi:hypothetical protein